MLTDLPEVYRTDRVEAAKRTAPVLFTQPGELYDVDPSRSSLIGLAGTQLSGSGPRPFDADQREVVSLYQLDIARPFDQWTVLARTRDEGPIPLAELGLLPGTDYVGFEFWTKQSLGTVRDTLRIGPIDEQYDVQVICLHPRVDHPQVLSTNRHVTCGGPDLHDVVWHDNLVSGTLTGESELVAGDRYEVFLTEPEGYQFDGVTATGARVVGQDKAGACASSGSKAPVAGWRAGVSGTGSDVAGLKWAQAVAWIPSRLRCAHRLSSHGESTLPASTARLRGACLVLLVLLPARCRPRCGPASGAPYPRPSTAPSSPSTIARPQVRGRDSLFGTWVALGRGLDPRRQLCHDARGQPPHQARRPPDRPGQVLALAGHPAGRVDHGDRSARRMYHVPYPDSTADQIRYQVKPGTGPFTEMLTFSFQDVHGDEGTLILRWGTTQVTFKVEVEPKFKLTLAAADAKPYLGAYQLPLGPGPDSSAAFEGYAGL